MLVVEDILKSMKKHFPRWMDIRRKHSSTGSLLLESISEEIADIQEAIEDYKKDFFIDNYINKEDDILAFLFKATVGQVDINNIILINPDIEIVEDENYFYENEKSCYYSDGILYFKEDFKEIQYAINGYKSTAALEKMHVWNVFDEFAAFVGLKRFQWETNKELVNRILAKSNRIINSSENGLKEALIANLINLDPNLSKDEILIERPTPENLMYYYDEFNTLLDHLNEVNRDIYKNKKWDIDTWNFDKKCIDYIPHAWDVALNYYTNGIGDNDDLKVVLIDNDSSTDVTINVYKKTIDAINSYIKNHNIQEDFEIKLKKYSNDLKPENVRYSITASEVMELNPATTKIELYQEEVENTEVLIQDIVDDFLLNTNVKDNSILSSDYKYKLRFIPTDKFGNFKIDELKQLNSNGVGEPINLIRQQEGFKFNDLLNESVISGKVIKHATNKYHFNSTENVKKTTKGLEVNNVSTHAKFTLNVNGCSNEAINYKYEYNEVPLLYSNIKMKNCYIENDYIISDTVEEEKYVEINTEMNSISMIITGPYIIEYSVNGGVYTTKSNYDNIKSKFEISGYNTPKQVKIRITFINPKSKVSSIKYSKYDFILKTEFGEIYKNLDKEHLPSIDKNNVLINMKSYTGDSLVLKYIHIGSELQDRDYYGDIDFDPTNGDKLIAKYEDCRLQLSMIDKVSNEVIDVIEEYIPYKIYSATGNEAVINLSLDEYKEIEKIDAEDCEIDTLSYDTNNMQYLLKIPFNTAIYKVNISGSSKVKIKTFLLDYILEQKGFSVQDNLFYITKNSDKIIAQDRISKELSYTNVERRDLFNNINIKNIKVSYEKENEILTKFMQIDASDSDVITNTITNDFEGSFDFLTFIPTKGDKYVAINEHKMILPELNNIKIVNTFSKGYNSNLKMFYSVKSLNENYDVCFENELSQYSLDEDTIVIRKNDREELKYNYEEVTVKTKLPLNTRIELPEYFILPNKEKINLNQYIITNYDDIIFKTKDNDQNNKLDYLYRESVYVNVCGFNKLKYSNVHQIISINKHTDDNISEPLIENVHYKILYKEGIIVWLDQDLVKNNAIVDVSYYIKIAAYIEYSFEKLYEIVKYDVSSLTLIDSIKLKKLSNNNTVSLNNYDSYKNSDIVTVHCDEPGFSASIENDILILSKKLENNTVAVKSGYYYMDGIEYYMFANDNSSDIEKIDDIYLNNVFKQNKKYLLKQESNNFVKNTSMINSSINDIFNIDFTLENNVDNKLNSLTACNTYNYWTAVGCNLSIVNGLNGQGIKLTSLNNINGYAYINISKFLNKDISYILSFYMSGKNSKAYLGKEKIMNSSNSVFNKESIIEVISEIGESEYQKNIFEIELLNNKDTDSYYLIIHKDCIIDDILIVEKLKYDIEMHTKNIDHLKFNIEENIYTEYATRLYLTDKNGATFNGTEILEESIVNTSNMHWGYTSIKKINSYSDYKKCVLTNVDLIESNNKCIAKTINSEGSILTSAIYLGNINVVKNLAFKINNVMFNEMKDLKVTVLTSSNSNQGFKKVSQHLSNMDIISGKNLKSYIKILVEMPTNKVINNIEIFAEYLSNDVYHPNNVPTLEGVYISKVLDINYTERYKVKDINFSDNNLPITNYVFEIRASKENNENTVWTDWKTIDLKEDNSFNRIVFEDYRYFQFRLKLKGENASIKLNYIDLEVI